MKGIKPGGCNIYWCDGNHEEHSCLVQDGAIHKMYEHVYHGTRGSTLILPDNRVVLFAGGADSIDKKMRTPGHDWFPEENITYLDLNRLLSHSRVDIVISHTCPSLFDIEVKSKKIRDANRIALDLVLTKYKPSLWFFGHWHKHIQGETNNTKWFCLDCPQHCGKWWMWCP